MRSKEGKYLILTLKQVSIRLREYDLKFREQVSDMRKMMSFFVHGLGRLLAKEGKTTLLIGDMDIPRIMTHVHPLRWKS